MDGPAIGGNAHAARHLGIYDGLPMGMPLCSGHLLPPGDEYFSWRGLLQWEAVEKMS